MKYENIKVPYNYDKKYEINTDFIPNDTITMHCWWNGTFGRKQFLSVKSIIATQIQYKYKINIWCGKDFTVDRTIHDKFDTFCQKYNINVQSFELEQINITPLNGHDIKKGDSVCNSDIVRFIILYLYGGLWFDLDCLFLKDISNLYVDNFAYAWEFQQYGNSAMFYIKDKPIIEKLMNYAIEGKDCRPWITFRYSNGCRDYMTIYPTYIFDPIWDCTYDSPIQNPHEFFSKECNITDINKFYPNSYVYHWHNCWNDEIKKNSYFECLQNIIDTKI